MLVPWRVSRFFHNLDMQSCETLKIHKPSGNPKAFLTQILHLDRSPIFIIFHLPTTPSKVAEFWNRSHNPERKKTCGFHSFLYLIILHPRYPGWYHWDKLALFCTSAGTNIALLLLDVRNPGSPKWHLDCFVIFKGPNVKIRQEFISL